MLPFFLIFFLATPVLGSNPQENCEGFVRGFASVEAVARRNLYVAHVRQLGLEAGERPWESVVPRTNLWISADPKLRQLVWKFVRSFRWQDEEVLLALSDRSNFVQMEGFLLNTASTYPHLNVRVVLASDSTLATQEFDSLYHQLHYLVRSGRVTLVVEENAPSRFDAFSVDFF